MKTARLSVVILNWNGRKVMERFLPSVVKSTVSPDVSLIVADNGSTDDSVAWLRERFPEVEVMELGENYGFAEGYNRAIRKVESPYIVLLNSDVETPEGWWEPLLDFMESHPESGAVQPKVLAYRERGKFEHAGAAGGLLDRLGYPYARGRVLFYTEEDKGQYDSDMATEVAWASGACMMVRRRAYLEAGGLDSDFFAHMEEIDLCWRMRLAGYRVYALTSSAVYHYGGASLAYGNPRKTYLNFRNNLLMLHKNLPLRRGKRVLIERRLADTLGFLFFLARGKWGDAKAVLKAHRDFRRMRGNYKNFPAEDIMKDLPGTDRYVYLDFLFRRSRV
ncbi:MAG: glycosyltransferase family 2 protein [Muribaculaceae bacterium]|nr:glycosyltransferase family 2 protein [Muribaculaceae bacterium]